MTRGPGYLNPGTGFPGEQIVQPGEVDTPVVYPFDPAGPVPPDLRWVVLTNASPFTLLIKQGAVLGWLAAFTSDVFYAPASNGQLPLTYTSIQATSDPQPGFNHQLFSVWYETDPGGIYPANVGAGEVKLAANTTLLTQTTIANPGGFPYANTFLVDQFGGVVVNVDTGGVNITVIVVSIVWEASDLSIVSQEAFYMRAGNLLQVRIPVWAQRMFIEVDGIFTGNASVDLTVNAITAVATHSFAGPGGGLHSIGVMLDNTAIAVGAGATVVVDECEWIYGGPVCFNFATSLTAFIWSVECIDAAGTFNVRYSFRAGDFGAGVQRTGITLLIPAATLRVRATNSTGAPGDMRVTAIADIYR